MGLTLQTNSKAGNDAVDSSGIKYQIKSRRIIKDNGSTQLSAIRNLETQDFNYLIAVLFNEMFEVGLVVKLPHEIIGKIARFSKHINTHLLTLKGAVLTDPLVENLTSIFPNRKEIDLAVLKQKTNPETPIKKTHLGGAMDGKLKKLIQSVGKGCFVEYFEDFRDETNSTADLVELLVREKGFTENACRTRISKSRKIINSGDAEEVLQNISESSRLPYKVTTKARELLKKILLINMCMVR